MITPYGPYPPKLPVPYAAAEATRASQQRSKYLVPEHTVVCGGGQYRVCVCVCACVCVSVRVCVCVCVGK